MKQLRRHLSYANVAATLALVLAMTGGAIAATGGFASGGKLQACVNGEGRLKLLKSGEHCRRGQKSVSWSQVGPAGAPGAPGAPGPKGTQGPQGEKAFSHTVVRTGTTVGLISGSKNVKCEPGEVATGGGATRNDLGNNSKIYGSVPTNDEGKPAQDGQTPTGWITSVENIASAETTTFYVVCSS